MQGGANISYVPDDLTVAKLMKALVPSKVQATTVPLRATTREKNANGGKDNHVYLSAKAAKYTPAPLPERVNRITKAVIGTTKAAAPKAVAAAVTPNQDERDGCEGARWTEVLDFRHPQVPSACIRVSEGERLSNLKDVKAVVHIITGASGRLIASHGASPQPSRNDGSGCGVAAYCAYVFRR
jgi:hypothetical protein